jgi:hypothetical protein
MLDAVCRDRDVCENERLNTALDATWRVDFAGVERDEVENSFKEAKLQREADFESGMLFDIILPSLSTEPLLPPTSQQCTHSLS